MKKWLHKKQLVAAGLVIALGSAVYLNYYFTKEPVLSVGGTQTAGEETPQNLGEATFVSEKKEAEATPADEPASAKMGYFDKARQNRNDAREETLAILKEIQGEAGLSEEKRNEATDRAQKVAETILKESNAEGMILAKGFEDCVVYIDGERVSAAVKAEQLDSRETVQIMEILVSQTGFESKNVQILPVAQ